MVYIKPNTTPSWDTPLHLDALSPITSLLLPSTSPSFGTPISPNSNTFSLTLPSSSITPSENCHILMLGTTSLDSSDIINPGKNCYILMPRPNCLDSLDTAPSLRQSLRSCTPSSHLAPDDGLLPSHCFSNAISDSTSAASHWHSSWTLKCSPLFNKTSDQLLTIAFLSKFSPF